MRTEMALYAVPLFISAGILLAITFYSLFRRRASGAASLSLLGFFAAWWAFCDAMLVLSGDWDTYVFWWKIGYIGIYGLPLALIIFALDYAGHQEYLTRGRIAALAAPLVVAFALILTEPNHGLMWTVEAIDWSQPYAPVLERGVAFWLTSLYVYGLMFAAAAILFRLFKRSLRVYRSQTYIMLFAIVVPFLPSMVHVLGINPIQEFDVTPIALAFAAPALAFGVFHSRLRDFVPVARRAVFDELDDGVIIISLDDRVIDINRAAIAALGLPAASDWSRPLAELHPQFAGQLGDAALIDFEFTTGVPPRHYDVSANTIDDDRGVVAARVAVFRDVTDRRVLERQLAYNAERDALTGLLNRARFDARLHERWLAEPADIAVMFVDLDNFKPVNDEHGHHAGDEVLRAIGDRIVASFPEEADIARWGGDEFAVAMCFTSRTAIREIVQTLRTEIERPITLASGRNASVSASIGLAFGRDMATAGNLLQEADARMYVDKARRRIPSSGMRGSVFDNDPARVTKI